MNAHFGPSTESGMRWRSAGREDCPRSSTRSGHAISEVAASLIGADESVALCEETRRDRVRGPRICRLVRKDEASGTKPASVALCGKTRQDRLRRPLHLWLCAERRGRIAYEGPAFVALCGKTRPDRLRRPLHLWLCAERRGRIAYEGPA